MKSKKPTLNSIALGNLKHRKKQYISIIIGIVLAIFFSSGALFFFNCLDASQKEITERALGKQQYIVINPDKNTLETTLPDDYIEYINILGMVTVNKDLDNSTPIAFMDDNAKKMYYQTISDGIYPEKEGEVAIEESTLKKLFPTAKLGDTLTFDITDFYTDTPHSSNLKTQFTEKEYKLVGILKDRKLTLDKLVLSSSASESNQIPSIFVAPEEALYYNGNEYILALVSDKTNNIINDVDFVQKIYNFTAVDTQRSWYSLSYADEKQSEVKSMTFTFISALLSVISCFYIGNTFSSDLKRRKRQIGMLRAVGTTKRQIVNVYLRESLIISAVATPLAILLSYFTVKSLGNVILNEFVFKPNFKVLIYGALLGFSAVIISAIFPLISISRLSPVQAIRDIEYMRKVKKKKIKSEKTFKVPLLLAKRTLTFSKGKTVAISILISISVLAGTFGFSFYRYLENEFYTSSDDYEISPTVFNYIGDQTFINTAPDYEQITENKINQALLLDDVKNVTQRKIGTINILVDGEYDDYLNTYSLAGYNGCPRFDVDYENEDYEKTGVKDDEYIKKTYFTIENQHYTEVKNKLDFDDKELFNIQIVAIDEKNILKDEKFKKFANDIDIEKLNSGEEILMAAPKKVGYAELKHFNGNGKTMTMLDLEKKDMKYYQFKDGIIMTGTCPYESGDKITLCGIFDDTSGVLKRTDKTVKIAAIDRDTSSFIIYTTPKGLEQLGIKLPIETLGVNLKEECTPETDEKILSELSLIFTECDINSSFQLNEADRAQQKGVLISVIALITILLCISITLINNSISSHIEGNKKTLGTLRAVGIDVRNILKTYFLQTTIMIASGTVSGTVIYCLGVFIYNLAGLPLKFDLLPILPILAVIIITSFLNTYSKVKRETNNSIVENIREL